MFTEPPAADRQIASPRATSAERMYALVEMEHHIAERVFAHERSGDARRHSAGIDWTVSCNGAPIQRE